MKTIKIDLEYQCYPMWIYNDKGELVDNTIANELENDTLIIKALDDIQKAYDNLFEDNEMNFEYKGFANEQEKEQFLLLVNETVDSIKSKLSNVYNVENKVNL